MAAKPLTAVSYIHVLNTDEVIPFDDLTDEQKESYRETMIKHLENEMSRYYSAHPDDFAKLTT